MPAAWHGNKHRTRWGLRLDDAGHRIADDAGQVAAQAGDVCLEAIEALIVTLVDSGPEIRRPGGLQSCYAGVELFKRRGAYRLWYSLLNGCPAA
jgi:hypothetical protein